MTTLNEYMRKRILDSVLAATDFADQKKAIEKEISEWERATIVAQLPKDFASLTAKLPAEWFRHTVGVKYKYNRDPFYCCNRSFESLRVPANFDCFINLTGTNETELDRQAEALRVREEAVFDAEYKVKLELEAFLKSVRTVKQAIERMPQLSAHLPTEIKPMPLVADTANLLTLLTTAGFDKSLKEAA